MDPENIESVTPIAGSPELRALVGDQVGVGAAPETAARRPDISFAEAADEAEFG